jgi:hypothetical protein
MAIGDPVLTDPNGVTVKKRTTVSGPLAYADQGQPGQSVGKEPVDPFGGLSMSKPTWDAANTTVQGMVSGEGYKPYATAQDQAFSRAAQNLRAQTGANNAPKIGQGAAVQAQQGTEQNILSGLSTMKNQQAMGEQEMKQSGISALGQLNSMSESNARLGMDNRRLTMDERTNEARLGMDETRLGMEETRLGAEMTAANDAKWSNDFNTALLYNDPSTPQGLKVLQNQYSAKFGYAPDFTQLKEQREYLKAKQGQDLEMGDIGIEKGSTEVAGMKQAMGADKYNAIANMVNTGATVDQINAQYGAGTLTADQYKSMAAVAPTSIATKQFAETIGLETRKIEEAARQFGITTDQASKQFQDKMSLDWATMSQQDKQFMASLGLDRSKFEASKDQFARSLGLETMRLQETARQYNWTFGQVEEQFKAKLGYDYQALSTQDRQFFSSLGLDQAKFDEAKKEWQSSFEFQKKQWDSDLKLKYDTLAQDKDLANAGIVSNEKIAGMRISADQTIAKLQIDAAKTLADDRNALDQQNIDLNKAATYGYTKMPDGTIKAGQVAGGTFVKGQMDIQAERLGVEKWQAEQMNDLALKNYGLDSDKFAEALVNNCRMLAISSNKRTIWTCKDFKVRVLNGNKNLSRGKLNGLLPTQMRLKPLASRKGDWQKLLDPRRLWKHYKGINSRRQKTSLPKIMGFRWINSINRKHSGKTNLLKQTMSLQCLEPMLKNSLMPLWMQRQEGWSFRDGRQRRIWELEALQIERLELLKRRLILPRSLLRQISIGIVRIDL